MYFKLSLRSVKRSLSDFTVYFLTLTVGVCLFYVFNSLSAQQMVLDITTSQKDTISELSKMLTLVSVFVSIILGFLCLFGNSFLLKRRKKEFGLYMTLGMSKAKISSILIIETSIIAFLSLIVGIILGGIASQGMAAFTASLFEVNIIKYQFIFSISAMLKTIGYFICIFVVVMIFNTIMISRYTILDLLTATRKNQTIKLKKTSSAAILWFISLILIIGGYVMASKVGFSGSIVTLGISVGAIVIGTFMFYYSAGATILSFIQKRKTMYLKGTNTFVIRQIYSKITTSFFSITIISLMLFFTLSILTLGFSYKIAVENDLKIVAPYDATIKLYSITGEEEKEKQVQILKENGIELDTYGRYTTFPMYNLPYEFCQVFSPYAKGAVAKDLSEGIPYQVTAIRHSDYLKQMEFQNVKPIELNANETLIISNMNEAEDTIRNFTSMDNEITLYNTTYKVPKGNYQNIGLETENVGRIFACFVVPDDVKLEDDYYTQIYNIEFNKNHDEYSSELNKKFEYFYSEEFITVSSSIAGITKSSAYEIVIGETSTIIYVGIFIGIIFLIASGAVIGLQQLSEASDSSHRYKVLQRIGASNKQVKKVIFQQVLIYFITPLLLAIPHAVFAILFAHNTIIYSGNSSIITTTIASVIVFLLLYGAYFIATYSGYKRITKS